MHNRYSWLLIIVMFLGFGVIMNRSMNRRNAAGKRRVEAMQERASMQRLDLSWMMLQANHGSLLEQGYWSWTPRGMSEELIRVMTTGQIMTPEEAQELGVAGLPQPKPVPFRLDKPDGPFQIVLVPDDARKMIRVEMYGSDQKTPLKTMELFVASY